MARSPNLNPIDYFLCGHLKDFVYRGPVEALEDLEGGFYYAVAAVTPEMVQRAREGFVRGVCV